MQTRRRRWTTTTTLISTRQIRRSRQILVPSLTWCSSLNGVTKVTSGVCGSARAHTCCARTCVCVVVCVCVCVCCVCGCSARVNCYFCIVSMCVCEAPHEERAHINIYIYISRSVPAPRSRGPGRATAEAFARACLRATLFSSLSAHTTAVCHAARSLYRVQYHLPCLNVWF